jgi:hypothetical protein
MSRLELSVALLLLPLLPFIWVPGWGPLILMVVGSVLLGLEFRLLTGLPARWWWQRVAAGAGLLGGTIAATSAGAVCLATPGAGALELGFGCIAVAGGVLMLAGGLLAALRPQAGSVLLLGGSIIAILSVNLYNDSTLYALAVPLCWIGTILALETCHTPVMANAQIPLESEGAEQE